MFYRHHDPVVFNTVGPSRTKQSHKDECDIYRILHQYQRTGIIEHVNRAQVRFEDLPDSVDYQESIHTIMSAQQTFAALPASVRQHFSNDPQQFLAAFSDASQADYLRSVGLLQPLASPPAPIEPTAT